MQAPLLFLSHAGIDSDAALRLADGIEATPAARQAGLEVWIDKRRLVAGTSWQQQLEDAIERRSTAFAIYLTDTGAENWVRMEVRAALDRVIADGRLGRTYPFIPLVATSVPNVERLPLFARQYQGIDLRDKAALARLVAAAIGGTAEHRHVPLVDQPFRGLESFGTDDAHLFFGRRRETSEILERLKTTNLLIVVGDSGSGKSSLVKAGVVPAFLEGMLADPLEPRPAPGTWHVVQMRPSCDPIEGLIKGVSDAARGMAGINAALFSAACTRLRKREPAAMIDLLREGAPTNARCLLVVDQMEELWTQTLDEKLRAAFFDGVLSAAAADHDGACRVVATMRRDHVFQISSHVPLRDRLNASPRGGRYNLRRMDDSQLRECIEKPLALTDKPAAEARTLADEVLRDAGDEPGQLALLEMALFKTWEERRAHPSLLDAYKAIGRVEGALSRAADQALARLAIHFGADGPRDAQTIFVRLVTQSADGGVARRTARREEFAPRVWQVAQALGSREYNRLLVLGRKEGQDSEGQVRNPASSSLEESPEEPTVELAHEQITTQWAQYRLWLKGSAEVEEDKRALDRLVLRANDWSHNGRHFRDAAAPLSEWSAFQRVEKQRPQWLSATEQRFVRVARWRMRIPAFVLTLSIVAVLGAALSYIAYQRTQFADAAAAAIWNRLTLNEFLPFAEQDAAAIGDLVIAEDAVKLRFAQKLRTDSGLAARFNRHSRLLTIALAGDRPGLRAELLKQVVVPVVSEGKATNRQAVAFMGSVLESPAAIEPLLLAFDVTAQPKELFALMQALQVTAATLDNAQRMRVIEPVLRAMERTKESSVLRGLAQALRAVPGGLDQGQSTRAINAMLESLDAEETADALLDLAQGLDAVSGGLDDEQARRLLVPIVNALESVRNRIDIDQLEAAIRHVVPKASDAEIAHAIEPLLKAVEAAGDADALRGPAQGLLAFAPKLDKTHLGRTVDALMRSAGRTTETHVLRVLASLLRDSSNKLEEADARRWLDTLIELIESTGDPGVLAALAKVLPAVPVKPNEAQATRSVEPIVRAIERTKEPKGLRALAEALAVVHPRPGSAHGKRALGPLLQALLSTRDQEASRELTYALQAVPFTFDEEQSASALAALSQVIIGATKARASDLLPLQPLQDIAAKLENKQASQAVDSSLEALATVKEPRAAHVPTLMLLVLAARADDAQARRAGEALLQIAMRFESPDVLLVSVRALRAFGPKLDELQINRSVVLLLSSIDKTRDSLVQRDLVSALRDLSPALDDARANRAASALVRDMRLSKEEMRVLDFAQALLTIPGKLNADQLERAVAPLMVAIERTPDTNMLAPLAGALGAIASRLDDAQAARAVGTALKSPRMPAESAAALVKAVRGRPPAGLGPLSGLWDVLAWRHAQQ